MDSRVRDEKIVYKRESSRGLKLSDAKAHARTKGSNCGNDVLFLFVRRYSPPGGCVFGLRARKCACNKWPGRLITFINKLFCRRLRAA